MDWRLRIDVPKGKGLLVLVNDLGRYLTIDDLLKNRHSGFSLGDELRLSHPNMVRRPAVTIHRVCRSSHGPPTPDGGSTDDTSVQNTSTSSLSMASAGERAMAAFLSEISIGRELPASMARSQMRPKPSSQAATTPRERWKARTGLPGEASSEVPLA